MKYSESLKKYSDFGLVYNGLVKQQWFKNACEEWYLLNDSKSKDGEFLIAGDFIKSAKKFGEW